VTRALEVNKANQVPAYLISPTVKTVWPDYRVGVNSRCKLTQSF
jgi:hypothetical protein